MIKSYMRNNSKIFSITPEYANAMIHTTIQSVLDLPWILSLHPDIHYKHLRHGLGQAQNLGSLLDILSLYSRALMIWLYKKWNTKYNNEYFELSQVWLMSPFRNVNSCC